MGLAGFRGMISHVNFEVCRVNKLLGKIRPYVHISRCSLFLQDCFMPYRKFFLGNPTKIHLRIPEQGPARAHWKLPELQRFPTQGLPRGAPIPGLLQALRSGLATLQHGTTPDPYLPLWIRWSENIVTPLAIWVGEASVFSFRARAQSHFLLRLKVSNPNKKPNLKAATHFLVYFL